MKTYKRDVHDISEERKVLAITSFAEFAERYGYYVIQALLIFFLIDRFKISQEVSASLVGTTLAMTYISAIVGGYIAERLLGYYRSGLLGSVMMLLGFFLLASTTTKDALCLALSFICISTGLIKSNMASFIGRFYDRSSLDNSRRDFGFNIFYMGINLGGFLGLVFAMSLKDHYGYDSAFYSSLFVNLVMFILLIIGYSFVSKHMVKIKVTLLTVCRVLLIMFLYITLLFYIFHSPYVANFSVLAAIIVSLFILLLSVRKSSWNKVFVAVIFFILSILYWALYFQMFISLLLFTEYAVNEYLLNSSQLLSVITVTILLFAVVMGKLWVFLGNKGYMKNDIDKFNLAFVIIALSFLVIEIFIYATPGAIKVTPFAFILGYFLIGISELCLSAIGLSLITKIAPRGFVALYMGIWLITLGVGGKLAGLIASYFYIPENNIVLAKTNIADALDTFVVIAVLVSLSILLVRKYVNKYVA
ncbi:major facilitator transporter [Candidatus Francisella endociliophora]|uniref:Major facilitator transporter n=1 Tax=Candidatus Francisella endociliophora TaxID=653937 RepID=A0A097ENP1_9GAMM|nr:peptide MFS transporter [Francisella sp. FSC1006]AIT09183.1 major facilitator transporter [Francisella sp. FSC1006]